jgi:DNA uptake protein ComE-like DNA-binding protein
MAASKCLTRAPGRPGITTQSKQQGRADPNVATIIKADMRQVALLIACLAASVVWNGCFSCNAKQDPDALRRKTAEATSTLKSDTKAVGQGIAEGLRSKPKLDLNSANEADLAKLPGLTAASAGRIVRNRPYDNPDQLVTRRILTQEEYDQISGRVTVKK